MQINQAGKTVFTITPLEKLERFLTLGCTDNVFNATDNQDYISEFIKSTFDYVMEILENDDIDFYHCLMNCVINNKCKKQEPLIFMYALGVTHNVGSSMSLIFRKRLYSQLEVVCTTPTTLTMFVDYCKKLMFVRKGTTGWNNLHKKAIEDWYVNKPVMRTAYQITKYKQRNGYSHRDIMRLLHPKPNSDDTRILYNYMVNGTILESVTSHDLHTFLTDYDAISKGIIINKDEICALIKKHGLSREHVPNTYLDDTDIWKSLVFTMPRMALLRNLNKMTSLGLLRDDIIKNHIISQITRMTDIHPLQLLVCLKTYNQGHGDKGKLRWTPDSDVVQTLNDRFMDVGPSSISQKKICICLDVSGSMLENKIYGAQCLSAAEGVVAMAMVLKKKLGEKADIMAFSQDFIPLDIDIQKTLDENLQKLNRISFGMTDISLPFLWAKEQRKLYNTFIVMTDNETNYNRFDPMHTLINYRESTKIYDCGLLVLATSATDVSVGDPSDKYVLNISGFNDAVPTIIEDFCR